VRLCTLRFFCATTQPQIRTSAVFFWIDFEILQPFPGKAGAHEPGPFGFVESGGGDLLDGDAQVKQTRDVIIHDGMSRHDPARFKKIIPAEPGR
jgi:hypothetical protein